VVALALAFALASLQLPNALVDKVCRAIERERLVLRSERVDADRFVRGGDHSLPFLDAIECEPRHGREPKLAASRVYPDHGLVALRAEQQHVVVVRDDHLICLLSMSEDLLVRRPARGLVVLVCADVAHPEPEGSEGTRDFRREEFIEQEADPRPYSCRIRLPLVRRQAQ